MLVTTFWKTIDALPCQKQVCVLNSKITFEHYLALTLKWSHVIRKCLKSAIREIQQYKKMMTEFEGPKHMHYQAIYDNGYSDGCASGKMLKAICKPIDVSWMFTPHSHLPLKNHHLQLPLREISSKFISIFLIFKLMKHHRTLPQRDANINMEQS